MDIEKNGQMDIENLLKRLKEFGALRAEDELKRDVVDSIQPEHADKWPKNLHPSIRAALDRIDEGKKRKPYKHQFDAVSKSLD